MRYEDKTVPITGITSQDGSYVAELLMEKGYEVYGIKRLARSLIPTNLYGSRDHYHPTNRHMLPALIQRCHETAQQPHQGAGTSVAFWSTCSPLREFLNVGKGVDLSIRDPAEQVTTATFYRGTIKWDTNKPDGTPKKLLDVSHLVALGWRYRIPLAKGLASTVADHARHGTSRS